MQNQGGLDWNPDNLNYDGFFYYYYYSYRNTINAALNILFVLIKISFVKSIIFWFDCNSEKQKKKLMNDDDTQKIILCTKLRTKDFTDLVQVESERQVVNKSKKRVQNK